MSLLPGFAPTAAEARAEETDTAERQDDPTPRGTIRAVLGAVLGDQSEVEPAVPIGGIDRCSWSPPLRVLDVCAGYGAWASEMRRLARRQGLPVVITGVELHAPRQHDLRKWCDLVMIDDWRHALDNCPRPGVRDVMTRDIIIGNPHFTALTHEDPAQSMPAVLLEHAPAVLLLHTQQAFLRGEAGRAAWRRCPPAAAWLVPGSVKFRGPGTGSDARCYQVSLWLRGHEGPTATHILPELTAAERQWTVPPGSEAPSADLPAAPGWTP